MIRSSRLIHRRVADLLPGELLRVSFGGRAGFAIFMKHMNHGSGLLGVVKSEDFNRPMTWYTVNQDEKIMSYGSDWFLEEDHGDNTAAGRRHLHEQARLHIDEDGLVMTFIPPAQQPTHQYIHFSLSSFDKVELGRNAAPIIKWRIWENERHYDRGGAPLLEMAPPA